MEAAANVQGFSVVAASTAVTIFREKKEIAIFVKTFEKPQDTSHHLKAEITYFVSTCIPKMATIISELLFF
jgi:hypothetical protein